MEDKNKNKKIGGKPADDKEMAARKRRIYLQIRIEELRAELAKLTAERSALAGSNPKKSG